LTDETSTLDGVFLKIPFFLPSVIFVVLVSGCSTGGLKSNSIDYNSASIASALEGGDIVLTCNLACAFQFGYHSSEIAALYDAERWRELAIRVANIGYNYDLAYFYLGKSAEGMSFIEGAKRFYKRAQHHQTVKCGSASECDGISLPDKAIERLVSLRSEPEDELEPKRKPEVERDLKLEPTSPVNNLVKDIKAILKAELVKGPLEKTTEFEERVAKMVDQYEGRQYIVEMEVKNPENQKHKVVSYDPDAEVMHIELDPKNLGTNVIGNAKNLGTAKSTFAVEMEGGDSFYVDEFRQILALQNYHYGMAILNDSIVGTHGSSTFSFETDREMARTLLASGRLVLTVEADFRYLDDDKSPLLMSRQYPLVYRSYDVRVQNLVEELPVQLIKVELRSQDGAVVFERDF